MPTAGLPAALAVLLGLAAGPPLAPLAPSSLTLAQRRTEAQAHFSAGQESMHAEAFEEAVREFRAAIALDPLLILAHYDLGQAYMALKAYPAAVQAYLGCRAAIDGLNSAQQGEDTERSHEIDDQIRGLQDMIRRMRTARGAPDQNEHQVMMVEERIRVLEGLRFNGRDKHVQVPAELYLALGSAYFRQGDLAQAEKQYTDAVKTDGKLGPAHNNLAVIYMMSGRYKEAHAALAKAEKSGFLVNPNLKRDLAARESAARD